MHDLQLLIDLHRPAERQGPGGEEETLQAMKLAGLDRSRHLKIADIGCGTGASALILARELDAQITAVDLAPEFLDTLRERAEQHGVADKITPLKGSMDALPFAAESLDVIWSEGAVYNLGFEAGVAAWRQFLKPDGVLVVSEITYLTDTRPAALEEFWQAEYPQITTAEANLKTLKQHGYHPEGHFILPPHCWLENYYHPMQTRFETFLAQHTYGRQARAVVAAEQREMALYEKYQAYYGYGFYVARVVE